MSTHDTIEKQRQVLRDNGYELLLQYDYARGRKEVNDVRVSAYFGTHVGPTTADFEHTLTVDGQKTVTRASGSGFAELYVSFATHLVGATPEDLVSLELDLLAIMRLIKN